MEATLERTETPPLIEALEIIQKSMAIYGGRGLVSADEVCDLLLDLQQLIGRAS